MTTSTTLTTARSVPALLAEGEARIDGREKVSGQAKYTADYAREGMLWAAFVDSPYPHARIVRVETGAAREMPGVRAIVTGADVGARYMGCTLKDWPVLAVDRVKFIGEYVAAVAADTPEQAAAAAKAIEVEYEELPALLDADAALAEGAEPIHPDEASYVFVGATRPPRPHYNMQGYDRVRKGDPETAFAGADRIFEHTFHTPRYHAGYIEPRATLVWIDEDETLRVLTTSKNPFAQRDMLAETLELPKNKVVVEPSYIGGEFGAKALTIEEFALYYLARATGRAVKHVRTHADDVRSSHVRHAAAVRVRLGTTRDGKIVAFDLRALFDGGAYGGGKPGVSVLPGRTPKLPYGIHNAQVERICAYTHTIPGAFVRAPGDIQIMFAVESLMDMAAAELGIDPIEFRQRNAAVTGDTDLEGNRFTEPRPRQVLATLRDAIHWDEPLPPGRGRGISLTARHIAGGKTAITVTARPDGTISAVTGSSEPGVGTLTVVQRVLAAELGLDPDRVRVTRGATDTAPWDPGIGGSKGTMLLGRAALDAAHKLQVALALPHDGPVTVTGEGAFVLGPGENMWLNFGAYGVELSVDRETGTLTLHDVVFVADIGTIVNPIAHRGQIDGGFLMGLGVALTEELVLEDGRIVNIALSDYKLPTQRDMPPFRVIELQPGDGPGPYGARAAGEMNTAGVAPAIANAVAAACGVRVDRLGITAERIYDALHAGAAGPA